MAQAVNISNIHTKIDNHQYESYVGKEKCVLVSDLSGSTSTTRKYGFIHWASIVARMQQIILPIFYEQCHALFIAKEADDLIAVFNKPEDALAAACYMKSLISYYNSQIKTKYSDRAHFMIKLGGIGVHIGNDVVINKTTHNIYGKTFEYAFQLGENIADNGDVIFSDEFVNSLRNNKDLHSLIVKNTISSDEIAQEEPSLQEEKKELVKYRKIDSNTCNNDTLDGIIQQCGFSWPSNYIAGVNDKKYLKNEGLLLLAQRYNFDGDLNDVQYIDNHIKKDYTSKKTAIMFNARVSTENFNDRLQMVKLFDQVYDQFGDELFEIGATYLLFNNSASALKCVFELKNLISKWNNNPNANYKIITSGFGLHYGDILSFPEEFMQFGDALNTASKIGEDLGKGGDIVITEDVKQSLNNENVNLKLQFEAHESNISGLLLKYYIVTTPATQAPSYNENNANVIKDSNKNNNYTENEDMKVDNQNKSSNETLPFGSKFFNPYNKLRRQIRRRQNRHEHRNKTNNSKRQNKKQTHKFYDAETSSSSASDD